MKKRTIWIIVSAVILAAALAVLAILAFSGGKTPEKPIDVTGTWKVAVFVQDGKTTIVENEYMVFDAESAKDYRDASETPFAVSPYSIKDATLDLPDLSRTYNVEKRTDHYMCLYQSRNTYLELIRQQDDRIPVKASEETLEGTWSIAYRRTDKPYAGQRLRFADGIAQQFQPGSDEPVGSSAFAVENGVLTVPGWNKKMALWPLDEKTVLMVELSENEGFIWEIHKES